MDIRVFVLLATGKLCECERTVIFFQSFSQWNHLTKCEMNGLDNTLYIIMCTSNVYPASVDDYSFSKVYISEFVFFEFPEHCANLFSLCISLCSWVLNSSVHFLLLLFTCQQHTVSYFGWVNGWTWLLLLNIFKQTKMSHSRQHSSMFSCLYRKENCFK